MLCLQMRGWVMKRIEIGRLRAIGLLSAAVIALLGCLLCVSDSLAASGADVNAVLNQSRAANSGDDFLPPEQAFVFSASAENSERVRLTWVIAPGYYLYRDRIKATSEAGPSSVGPPEFPPGQVKSDEYFGKQVVYHDELLAMLPVKRSGGGKLDLSLNVTYQGC